MEFLRHRALVLRGLWTLPNDVQLVAQAKTLCGDCIKWRLSRTGTTFNASSQSSAPSYKSSRILAEASCVLLLFAQELEAMFPDLFHNVDRKLQILALAELEVSEALHAFATLLFYEQLGHGSNTGLQEKTHWPLLAPGFLGNYSGLNCPPPLCREDVLSLAIFQNGISWKC
uniref:Uncharacterized protein n=1 Tax=Eptatretus burgeri TaxID=7764 RepID=A0A8C4QT86_EPTBU